jgi:hypothetical protein
VTTVSFPKIISGRNGGAIRTGSEWGSAMLSVAAARDTLNVYRASDYAVTSHGGDYTAQVVEAVRAPLRSRRIASERVISSRFGHRSMALIVSDGSRTRINGSASVVVRPFLDWTVFGMADKLLSRVFGGYIPASPLNKRSLQYHVPIARTS